MKTIKQAVILIIVSFVSIAGVSMVYSWTGPTQSPPGGNIDAPINVSGSSQYKSGALGVGGLLRGYSTAIFDGNVGIGITSPTQKLDVSGYVKGTGLCIGSDCRTSWPAGGGSGITSINGAAGPAISITGTGGTSVSTSGNNIYINSSSSGGGGITGSGSMNYIPKWTGATSLGNSSVQDFGSYIQVSGLKFGLNSAFGTGPGFAVANDGITTGVRTENFNVVNTYGSGYSNVWAQDYYIGAIGKWASQLGSPSGGGGTFSCTTATGGSVCGPLQDGYAYCPGGYTLTGGGHILISWNGGENQSDASAPSGNAWRFRTGGGVGPGSCYNVYAVCCKI